MGESARAAWRALLANGFRSTLTMLGVVIGVAAVIALVSVGEGASEYITGQIQAMGSNLIIITPRTARLRVEDAAIVLGRVPGILYAMPTLTYNENVRWQTGVHRTAVEGVTADYPQVRNATTEHGRFLVPHDEVTRARVAVIGQTVAEELFGGADPLGRELILRGQPFTVVGVMERKGQLMGQDNDNRVLVPLSTLQRLGGTQLVQAIYCQLGTGVPAAPTAGHILGLLDEVHRRQNSVRVQSQEQVLDMVASVSNTLSFMLGAIAGVSLLVGGIGIMNIMLVSVTERTREIGIRKAVGGKRRDVLAQFLVESVLLSTGGGAIGIAIGAWGAGLLSRVGGWPTLVSAASVSVSFVFALAVGVFFGMYPAVRASNLDPIVALRRD
jgi:putative ABC transport system permease protein